MYNLGCNDAISHDIVGVFEQLTSVGIEVPGI